MSDQQADNVRIEHAERKHRYEVWVGDDLAGFTRYTLPDDDHVDFIHTEVGDRYAGQGLAARLVREALDDVRAQGKRIIPHCPYVASYVRKHDDWADLVDWP
ncbi:GNAT family N-acetyltransferase [Naumannella huperziae]